MGRRKEAVVEWGRAEKQKGSHCRDNGMERSEECSSFLIIQLESHICISAYSFLEFP